MNKLEKEVYVVVGISYTNDWKIFSVHLEESEAKKKADEIKLGFEENKKLLETLKSSYKSNGYMMKYYLNEAINALSRLIDSNNYWNEITYRKAPFIESTNNSDDKNNHVFMQNICKADQKIKMRILESLKNKDENVEELDFSFWNSINCLACREDWGSGAYIYKIIQNGSRFDAEVNNFKIVVCGTLYDCLKACNDHCNNAKKYGNVSENLK